MSMIETAEIVAERYGISRERQDEYALESQRRTAAAQQANKFKDEIVPLPHEDEEDRQGERHGIDRRLHSRLATNAIARTRRSKACAR